MSHPNPAVAVVGIGNLLLTDEGLGVHALRALSAERTDPEVQFIEGGTDPWAALGAAQGCETVLVLDAVLGGGAPGEFHRIGLDEVAPAGAGLSLHGFTLFHLVEFERALGNSSPDVRVLGMEPASTEPRIGLSDACLSRFDSFLDMVRDEIRCACERARGAQGA